MIFGDNLQDNLFAKEEAKIKAKREANAKRAQRFLDSRNRLIGLDVDALDEQVAEIQRRRQADKGSGKMDRLRYQEIEKALEAADEEERQLRSLQVQDLKQTWRQQTEQHNATVNKKELDYDFEKLSAASAQLLDGEDRTRALRIKAQKEQMKRWIQEQISEKAYSKEVEKQEDMKYAEVLKVIGDIRDLAEQEETAVRKDLLKQTNDYNLELMKIRQEARAKEKEVWDSLTPEERGKFSSLDLFNEDTSRALDENGRVVRKDLFKGFTQAQKRRIYQENEALIQQKRDRDSSDKNSNYEWTMQQRILERALENAHYDETLMRKAEQDYHMSVLDRQLAEEQDRKESRRKDRYGTVSEGFFEGFGKSCR